MDYTKNNTSFLFNFHNKVYDQVHADPPYLSDFYSSFLGVPLAGATLPVISFFLLGIYGKVVWLLIAVIILGVGHIGIHIQHRRMSGS